MPGPQAAGKQRLEIPARIVRKKLFLNLRFGNQHPVPVFQSCVRQQAHPGNGHGVAGPDLDRRLDRHVAQPVAGLGLQLKFVLVPPLVIVSVKGGEVLLVKLASPPYTAVML